MVGIVDGCGRLEPETLRLIAIRDTLSNLRPFHCSNNKPMRFDYPCLSYSELSLLPYN